MFRNLLNVNALVLLLIVAMMSSCSKETENVSPENYGGTETYAMQKNLNAGLRGCLEVVFPIDLTLPDDSVIEVSSFIDAKEQLVAWKEANPDVDGRPSVVYPVEVITSDGETASINSKSEIIDLIKDCKGNFDRPRDHRPCFKLQYPVSVAYPNVDAPVEYATPRDLKIGLREWRKENQGTIDAKPSLVFPLVIVFADQSTQEIANAQELAAAKRACKED